MKIRTLLRTDLLDVSRIQRECYSQELLESADSFLAKLSVAADSCFIAVRKEMAMGYVIALPALTGEIIALNGVEYSVPARADSLYIHDMAVSLRARKAGVAQYLLDAVFHTAKRHGYQQVSLVAIEGAASYWKRHGFKTVSADKHLHKRLVKYGERARYMSKLIE